MSPSPIERQMFLQAESLYRYRFEPPARSPGMYAAQVLAVAAELPALQAFSGSLDLTDLRLKMCDGAVHLWGYAAEIEEHRGGVFSGSWPCTFHFSEA